MTTSASWISATVRCVMSATVRTATTFKVPPLENLATSRGHCRSSCDGASTSVALVGIARTGTGLDAVPSAPGTGHWIWFARIAPIVMAVLPYPTWSAMIPPRTSFFTRARPSMRSPSAGSTDSATSSSTNGACALDSRSSIQCSERSCSGLSGNCLTFHPGGCAAAGSRRLDVSLNGSRGAAVSISACRTTCHSISGVAFFPASYRRAAERSRATPPVMLASARCTSVAGFTAITTSPVEVS